MVRWSTPLLLAISFMVLAGSAPVAGQVPPQTAVEVTLDVTPHGTPIEPGREVGEAAFEMTMVCASPTLPQLTPIQFDLAVASPDESVQLTLAPAVMFYAPSLEDCLLGVPEAAEGTVTVSFDPDTPVGTNADITLTVDRNGEEVAHATWTETAA